jgi:hypothetical protein
MNNKNHVKVTGTGTVLFVSLSVYSMSWNFDRSENSFPIQGLVQMKDLFERYSNRGVVRIGLHDV